MAGIKELTTDEFRLIVAEKGFGWDILAKDYYLTILLYLIKDLKGLYFKGGTALQKTILDYSRISEDIDFTLDRPIQELRREVTGVIDQSGIFGNVTNDKDVDGFVRLVVPYKTEISSSHILIDLNKRAKVLRIPINAEIRHFYPNIPKFSTQMLSTEEMIAEKMAAAIGRNMPRDHYDLYMLIKAGYEFDLDLVRQKCNCEFDIVKMFNKAKKLHNRWNEDMLPLLSTDVKFKEVMTTIARHFKLRDAKETKRTTTQNQT